jgi:hypothetical protein
VCGGLLLVGWLRYRHRHRRLRDEPGQLSEEAIWRMNERDGRLGFGAGASMATALRHVGSRGDGRYFPTHGFLWLYLTSGHSFFCSNTRSQTSSMVNQIHSKFRFVIALFVIVFQRWMRFSHLEINIPCVVTRFTVASHFTIADPNHFEIQHAPTCKPLLKRHMKLS